MEGQLVGGLYGISLGRAFFGESMFSRESDASKVALAWLVARLKVGGFELLDCQFMTDHLRSLGARSEEHTSELQSLMRTSYAVFCLKQKNTTTLQQTLTHNTY